MTADNLLLVEYDERNVAFIGTREECENFLRDIWKKYGDKGLETYNLRYIKDGKPYRCASFVL